MSKSQRIKIYADVNYPNNLEDFITQNSIKIRNANPLTVECVFLEAGLISDISSASKAELEILDVGAINSPAPRSVVLLAQAESQLSSTGLNAESVVSKSSSGNVHATFELVASDLRLICPENPYTEKYLRISLCFEGGDKVCYAAGWIDVLDNFSADPNYSPISSPEYFTKSETTSLVNGAIAGSHTHEEYMQKESNLSDLDDAEESRENLSVYSKAQIDQKVSTLTNNINTSTSNLQNDISYISGFVSGSVSPELSINTSQIQKLNKKSLLIDSLQIDKLNRGGLWFAANSYATCANLTTITSVFSWCFDICMTWDDWIDSIEESDSNPSTWGYVGHSDTGEALPFLFLTKGKTDFGGTNSIVARIKTLGMSMDNKVLLSANDAHIKVFDGKKHSVVFIADGAKGNYGKFFLYVDGVLLANGIDASETNPIVSVSTNTFRLHVLGASNGLHKPYQLSRFKYFNFNVAEVDGQGEYTAPYTLADYIAGKDEPPSLHNAANYLNFEGCTGVNYSTTTVNIIEDGKLVSKATGVSGTWTDAVVQLPKSIKYGDIITFKFGQRKQSASNESMPESADESKPELGNIFGGTGTTTKIQFLTRADAKSNTTHTVVNSYDGELNSIIIQYSFGDTNIYRINSFPMEIYVNGALLSLADYTFNGKILDCSGNHNHAVITGDVKGTHDTAAEEFYQAVAARIGNVTV